MRRFRKLVVLDNILLPDDVWNFLRTHSDEVRTFGDRPIHGRSSDLTGPMKEPVSESEKLLVDFCEATQEYSRDQVNALVDRIGDADAIISCWTNLPDEVLSKAPDVKFIFFWTHAYAHRVNINVCKARGIYVDYVADYGIGAVTEYIFAALLNMERLLHNQQRDTLQGSWTYEYLKTGRVTPRIDSIPYMNLGCRKLGIVGLGSIGTRVAIAASAAFGMQVVYNSRTRKRELEGCGLRYASLSELLQESEIISLHLPPDVREPVITRAHMEGMRPGTVLINTGSGRSMDETAALDLAESGHLRLVLDVYESNPPKARLKRLAAATGRHMFTYRAAWYTRDALSLKATILRDKISAVLAV